MTTPKDARRDYGSSDGSTALRCRYVIRARKAASAQFAAAAVLAPLPIMWAVGLLHWTSPWAWVAPASCGVFAVSAFGLGITYRVQAAKLEQALRR